jgi:hypothetical protein
MLMAAPFAMRKQGGLEGWRSSEKFFSHLFPDTSGEVWRDEGPLQGPPVPYHYLSLVIDIGVRW